MGIEDNPIRCGVCGRRFIPHSDYKPFVIGPDGYYWENPRNPPKCDDCKKMYDGGWVTWEKDNLMSSAEYGPENKPEDRYVSLIKSYDWCYQSRPQKAKSTSGNDEFLFVKAKKSIQLATSYCSTPSCEGAVTEDDTCFDCAKPWRFVDWLLLGLANPFNGRRYRTGM